jgi:hypothetical protein
MGMVVKIMMVALHLPKKNNTTTPTTIRASRMASIKLLMEVVI